MSKRELSNPGTSTNQGPGSQSSDDSENDTTTDKFEMPANNLIETKKYLAKTIPDIGLSLHLRNTMNSRHMLSRIRSLGESIFKSKLIAEFDIHNRNAIPPPEVENEWRNAITWVKCARCKGKISLISETFWKCDKCCRPNQFFHQICFNGTVQDGDRIRYLCPIEHKAYMDRRPWMLVEPCKEQFKHNLHHYEVPTYPFLLRVYTSITRKQCKFLLQEYMAFYGLKAVDTDKITCRLIQHFLSTTDEEDVYVPLVQQKEDFKPPPSYRYLLINPVPCCQEIILEDTVKGIPIVTRHDTYEEALAASRKHTRFGIAILPKTLSETDETDIEIHVYDNICTEKDNLLENKPEDDDIPARQQSPERQFLVSFKLPRAQVQDPRIENSPLDERRAKKYVEAMSQREEKLAPIPLNPNCKPYWVMQRFFAPKEKENIRGDIVISCQKIPVGTQCIYKCTVNTPHIRKTHMATHRRKSAAIEAATYKALKILKLFPDFSRMNWLKERKIYFHIGRFDDGENEDEEIIDEAELKRRFHDRALALHTKLKLQSHEEDHRIAAYLYESTCVCGGCHNTEIDSQFTEILERYEAPDKYNMIRGVCHLDFEVKTIGDRNLTEWIKRVARKMEPIHENRLDKGHVLNVLSMLRRTKNKSVRGMLLAAFGEHNNSMLLPENAKDKWRYHPAEQQCPMCKKIKSLLYDDHLTCKFCCMPFHRCEGQSEEEFELERNSKLWICQCCRQKHKELQHPCDISTFESSSSPSTQDSDASKMHEEAQEHQFIPDVDNSGSQQDNEDIPPSYPSHQGQRKSLEISSRSSTLHEIGTEAYGSQEDNEDVLFAYSPGQSQRGSPENSPRSSISLKQDVDAHRQCQFLIEDVSPLYSPNQSPRSSSPKPSTSQEYDASKMHEGAQDDPSQSVPDVDDYGSQEDNEDISPAYPPHQIQRRSQNIVDVEEGVGEEQNLQEINKGQEGGN